MDGQSLLSSLTACEPDRPRTQYFEIGGKVGLYSDGWWASMEDDRPSWELLPPTGPKPKETWTLYDLTKDFSQSTDLSARYPEKLAQMQTLWEAEAKRNNVFPLDHRFGAARAGMAGAGAAGKHFDFWGKDVSLPALGGGPYLSMRSFTVTADIAPAKPDASGAVVAWGSYFGGWSLYLDHGKPAFVFAGSTDPNETQKVVSANALPVGTTKLTMRFASLGMGKGADVVVSSGGIDYARVHVAEMRVTPAGGGETLDIGRDLGVPVTDYATPRGAFEGDIPHVSIDFD
jgi:arylsulfatase